MTPPPICNRTKLIKNAEALETIPIMPNWKGPKTVEVYLSLSHAYKSWHCSKEVHILLVPFVYRECHNNLYVCHMVTSHTCMNTNKDIHWRIQELARGHQSGESYSYNITYIFIDRLLAVQYVITLSQHLHNQIVFKPIWLSD